MDFKTSIIATLVVLLFSTGGMAQNRKNRHNHKKVKNHQVHRTHKRSVKVTRHIHKRYSHLPKRGAVIKVQKNYKLVKHGGINYHFHQGVYYKTKGSNFVVVNAPRGLRIKTLPSNHRVVVLGTKRYYYYYSTFYSNPTANQYEVVDAPIGAEVDALPEGYDVVEVNGMEYYKLDNIYYEPRMNDKNEEYCVVVKAPL